MAMQRSLGSCGAKASPGCAEACEERKQGTTAMPNLHRAADEHARNHHLSDGLVAAAIWGN